ncbi:MAG: stage IV sporulation protein A [Bacillota bacterium]
MEKFDIFRDIAERTGGDIYVGVVGPVRTGKSTFIKKFMELLVLPNIADENERERAKDALPQSGAGRTVMTTEPKFVPDEGVKITIKDNITLRVRMVDCVGYTVEGALGYEDGAGPRMVITPWFDYEVPFEEAAELGTRKVIADHSTLGLVITTDGSITEIPREKYVEPEERVISELKEIGKPFVIVLNSTHPFAEETMSLAGDLEEKYDVSVIPVDCHQFTQDDIALILEQALYEFPVKEVDINLPDWVEALDATHWLRAGMEKVVSAAISQVERLKDVEKAVDSLGKNEFVAEVSLKNMEMGTGRARMAINIKDEIFFDVLTELTGLGMKSRADILKHTKELARAKTEYDKIASALEEVKEFGYGVVPPTMADMIFEEPELIRQGNRFGVRLSARAPSLHFLRADIETEVTPIMGTEKQCEELVKYLVEQFEDDPKKIWNSDIFGKPLYDLVKEGIQNKLMRMPENAQLKLQETVERIVNEGSGGLICIIL